MDTFVKTRPGENEMRDALHQTKFDGGFTSFFPFERILLKSFNIPILHWLVIQADPWNVMILKNPWELANTLPLMAFPSV